MATRPDPSATVDAARAAADAPAVTLSEMLERLDWYAYDTESHQHRLVEYGYRTQPDPGRMRDALVLRKAHALIERIKDNKQVLALLGFRPRAADHTG